MFSPVQEIRDKFINYLFPRNEVIAWQNKRQFLSQTEEIFVQEKWKINGTDRKTKDKESIYIFNC